MYNNGVIDMKKTACKKCGKMKLNESDYCYECNKEMFSPKKVYWHSP